MPFQRPLVHKRGEEGRQHAIHHNDTADFPPTVSRELNCHGYFRLNGRWEGSNNEFAGTTYFDPKEYWGLSYGVMYDETATIVTFPSHAVEFH